MSSWSVTLSRLTTDGFAAQVVTWQQQAGRHQLPWQQAHDPYHVLVSELMLQQTQVTTVIPYFARWLQQFPTLAALAAADLDQVLTAWQGLGYYRRARHLHAAAQYIVAHHQGQVPQQLEQLLAIPGVGRYTAGAIQAFAFDQPGVIVDGNVKRLFSRLFCIEGALNKPAVEKQLWAIAEALTPTQHNRHYAQGLLDLGATICKPTQPLCPQCPLQSQCLAWARQQVERFPERTVKAPLPQRAGYFAWDQNEQGLLLVQRPVDGIWPGLWCLPEVSGEALDEANAHGEFQHKFTHYQLNAQIYRQPILGGPLPQQRISRDQLSTVALPTPIKRYLLRHLPGGA